jgi:OmpA-OmpF porin, OOP family
VGGLVLAGAGGASAQDGGAPPPTELDLVLPVEDLSLATASLDDGISTLESRRRVRVTLAADVLFPFGRARLEPAAMARLDEVVARIRARRPAAVRIEGHTDAKGAPGLNRTLSLRRAEAVAAALREALGGRAPVLSTAGRGETEPVSPNSKPDGSDDPRGRARNRRVEISF